MNKKNKKNNTIWWGVLDLLLVTALTVLYLFTPYLIDKLL
jgi:hypothetical protein